MFQSSQTREKKLNNEVGRLRGSNGRIMDLSQLRESKLEQDFEELSEHLKRVQNQYEIRERTFLKEKARHLQDIATYEDLLKSYHQKESQAAPATDALRKEVSILNKQLVEQEAQITNLRELYLGSKHSERRTITKAISSVQSLLQDISKQQKLLIREDSNYTAVLRELEQQATEKEKQQTQHYYDICQQLDALRKEHNDYRGQKWESQIQELTEENVKLKQ